MLTLKKVQEDLGEDELAEEESKTFLEYLWDNKIEFSRDTAIDAVIEYAVKRMVHLHWAE